MPMKNVMQMFSAGAGNTQPVQQQPQPQHQVQQPVNTQQPATPVPNNPSPHFNDNPTQDPRPTEALQNPESPLAGLAKLWETDPKEGDNKPKGNPFDDPIFQFNEEEFSKRVNSMNFVDQQTLESVQERLIEGDTSALAELINAAARNAFNQATRTSTAAAEHAAKIAMQRAGNQVPDLLNTELTRKELATQNKLFSDPALRPVAESIANQYRNKYPDASPQDIAKYTQHFFQQISTQLVPQQNPTSQEQPEDFSFFFGG